MTDVKQTIEDIKALQNEIKEKRKSLESQAKATIEALTGQAYALIKEAEELAIASGESFDFSLEYGMGGTFDPDSGEWNSSSSMC